MAVATAIQGALLISVAVIGLPAALRMATILYAEDFDRAGVVPSWFAPWRLAMSYPTTSSLVLFVLGIVLVIVAVELNKRRVLTARWIEPAMLAILFVCLVTALAFVPLTSMGADWDPRTPAHEVRRTVIASAWAVCLELVVLAATILVIRRIRQNVGEGAQSSEA